MLRIFLSIVLLSLTSHPAFADKVLLKSGEIVEGEIIEKAPAYIKLEQKGGLIRQFFQFQYVSYEEGPELYQGELTDKKRKLINQVIDLTGMRTNVENNIKQLIDKAPLDQRPKMREIFVADEIIEAIVPFYAKYYNEAELQELIKFYQSPIGKKALSVTPQISRDAMQATLDLFKQKVNR